MRSIKFSCLVLVLEVRLGGRGEGGVERTKKAEKRKVYSLTAGEAYKPYSNILSTHISACVSERVELMLRYIWTDIRYLRRACLCVRV